MPLSHQSRPAAAPRENRRAPPQGKPQAVPTTPIKSPARIAADKRHAEFMRNRWADPAYRTEQTKPLSKEHKLEISKGLKKLAAAPGYIHNRTSIKHSQETRAKMAEAQKQRYRKGMPHPMKGKHHTKQTRQVLKKRIQERKDAGRYVNAMVGKKHSPQTRALMSAKRKGKLASIDAIVTASKRQESKYERSVKQVLRKLKVRYRAHVPLLKRYVADIVLYDSKQIIECDGTYWHNRPKAIEHDRKRDAVLQVAGYKIVRIKESQINQIGAEEATLWALRQLTKKS